MSQLNINACYTLKLNKSNLTLKGNKFNLGMGN